MNAAPPNKLIATLKTNFITTPILILIRPSLSISPLKISAKIAPTIAAKIFKTHGSALIDKCSCIFISPDNKKPPVKAVNSLYKNFQREILFRLHFHRYLSPQLDTTEKYPHCLLAMFLLNFAL